MLAFLKQNTKSCFGSFWFTRINPNKTELILFGANCTTYFSIQVAGALVKSTEKVEILGVAVC